MVWKSNFDSAEYSNDVRLQHTAACSQQAPPGSSMAHFPLNSHPSVLRGQVCSGSKGHPEYTDSKCPIQISNQAHPISTVVLWFMLVRLMVVRGCFPYNELPTCTQAVLHISLCQVEYSIANIQHNSDFDII